MRRILGGLFVAVLAISIFAAGYVSGTMANRDPATPATARPSGAPSPGAAATPSHGKAEATPQYLDGVEPTVSAAGFVHPGIYVDLPTLEFVRVKIAQGAEPWSSVFEDVANQPIVDVVMNWDVFSDAANPSQECNPQSGNGCVLDCTARGVDQEPCKNRLSYTINAAYLNALLWYYTGDEVHARNAVRLLNGYSSIFRGFPVPNDAGGQQGVLEASWMSQTILRAAEVIRYTYEPGHGDPSFDVEGFTRMVETALVPNMRRDVLSAGGLSSNWRSSAIEGLMNAAVFLDDRALYNEAITMWHEHAISYIYISGDGARANPAPDGLHAGAAAQDCYWIRYRADECQADPAQVPDPPLVYQNGQSLEVCRDMWHAGAGVGGIINAAETAWIQGDDLYGEQQERIMASVSYLLQLKQGFDAYGYPDRFCAGAEKFDGKGLDDVGFPDEPGELPTLSAVVAYNHYAVRRGLTFPTLDMPGYDDTYPSGDPVAAYIRAELDGPPDHSGFVTSWTVLTHTRVGDGIEWPEEPGS